MEQPQEQAQPAQNTSSSGATISAAATSIVVIVIALAGIALFKYKDGSTARQSPNTNANNPSTTGSGEVQSAVDNAQGNNANPNSTYQPPVSSVS